MKALLFWQTSLPNIQVLKAIFCSYLQLTWTSSYKILFRCKVKTLLEGQKCPLFVNIHIKENVNARRGIGGQKTQNIVNVVCERPLKKMFGLMQFIEAIVFPLPRGMDIVNLFFP